MNDIKNKLIEDIHKLLSGDVEQKVTTKDMKRKVYTVDIGKMAYVKNQNRPVYVSTNPMYVTIDQIIEMSDIQFLEINI
jgi:hypothetical protein